MGIQNQELSERIENMGGNDAMESIEIGNHRVDLMKKYKIIQ